MSFLNLGILAHVDAGKTTLTERLLYAAGALDTLGSVDSGTTQTDTMMLERRRGITIRAAVVAFRVDGVDVNLIDTPGHPDFIAEVDRALTVLDGAVLVVSAVQGVQPQTVVLMRALRRLRVPTCVFVNKIDSSGADPERVLATIRERLTPDVVAMGSVRDPGRPDAAYVPFAADDSRFLDAQLDVLADHDDALYAAAVDEGGTPVSALRLRAALSVQTAAGRLHPVFFESASTGAGVPELLAELPALLPRSSGSPDDEVAGLVFNVEREPSGARVAYVRLLAGTLHRRDRVALGDEREGTVTAIRVVTSGSPPLGHAQQPVGEQTAVAGQIAQVSGLRDVRVGDRIGEVPPERRFGSFTPPTMETVVVARSPAQQGALHAALAQLAEADPLINLRQDDVRSELFLSLYGEVQKEVIAETLALDGTDVDFRETTPICIERVRGTGHAVDVLGEPSNPFVATLGLTVEPGRPCTGLVVRLAVDLVSIPLYVYKSVPLFSAAMTSYLRDTLSQGLSGWEVHDCAVTITDCGYVSPESTAADFRKLTPLVLMAALQQAGTMVCEPVDHFRLDLPAETLSAALGLLGRHRAVPEPPVTRGRWCVVEGRLPAAEVQHLQRQLPGATHGEGVLEVGFDGYQPSHGPAPERPRTDDNPLNRKEYLLRVVRRGAS